MKKKPLKEKSKYWAAVHWLGSIKMIFFSEKECVKFCKKNSYNPKAPLYVPMPMFGVKQEVCDKCNGQGSLLKIHN